MSHLILSRSFSEAVSYDLAKSHLRIFDDEEKGYIESLIESAVSFAESYMNRLVIESTVVVSMTDLHRQLPLGRAKEIVEIAYTDRYGNLKHLNDYTYSKLRNIIKPSKEVELIGAKDFEVTIVTGWSQDEIPAHVKQALLMLVGTFYEMREDALVGQGISLHKVPLTHKVLLNKSKIHAL